MKKKLDKRSCKAIMLGIPKYQSSNNYYMYNVKIRRIISSRNIKWAPFIRPCFYEHLNEVLRLDLIEKYKRKKHSKMMKMKMKMKTILKKI